MQNKIKKKIEVELFHTPNMLVVLIINCIHSMLVTYSRDVSSRLFVLSLNDKVVTRSVVSRYYISYIYIINKILL